MDWDVLCENAARFVVASNTASVSLLQRHYMIGYSRAEKILSQLEMLGIVSPLSSTSPRKVLISPLALEYHLRDCFDFTTQGDISENKFAEPSCQYETNPKDLYGEIHYCDNIYTIRTIGDLTNLIKLIQDNYGPAEFH